MFYDASVGYVMALNLIMYILIALAASGMRTIFNARLSKWKHKSHLIIAVICFLLVLCREISYICYLFLIGAEMGVMTFIRMFLCAGYTSAMSLPSIYLIRFVLNWHPLTIKKKTRAEFDSEDTETIH